MCLILKNSAVEMIAKEDVKCIKVIRWNAEIEKWVTPYQLIPIQPGQHVTSEIITDFFADGFKSIDVGLHSFVPGVGKINNELEWFNEHQLDTIKAIECIIPKGSKYWLGDFEDDEDCSYVSDNLIYPKEF